jgi:hypothetical protein
MPGPDTRNVPESVQSIRDIFPAGDDGLFHASGRSVSRKEESNRMQG